MYFHMCNVTMGYKYGFLNVCIQIHSIIPLKQFVFTLTPFFYFYKMGIPGFTSIWCWRYMQSVQNHLEITQVGQDMWHVNIDLCFLVVHGQEQHSVFWTLVCAHTWQGRGVKKQMMELESCVTLFFPFLCFNSSAFHKECCNFPQT